MTAVAQSFGARGKTLFASNTNRYEIIDFSHQTGGTSLKTNKDGAIKPNSVLLNSSGTIPLHFSMIGNDCFLNHERIENPVFFQRFVRWANASSTGHLYFDADGHYFVGLINTAATGEKLVMGTLPPSIYKCERREFDATKQTCGNLLPYDANFDFSMYIDTTKTPYAMVYKMGNVVLQNAQLDRNKDNQVQLNWMDFGTGINIQIKFDWDGANFDGTLSYKGVSYCYRGHNTAFQPSKVAVGSYILNVQDPSHNSYHYAKICNGEILFNDFASHGNNSSVPKLFSKVNVVNQRSAVSCVKGYPSNVLKWKDENGPFSGGKLFFNQNGSNAEGYVEMKDANNQKRKVKITGSRFTEYKIAGLNDPQLSVEALININPNIDGKDVVSAEAEKMFMKGVHYFMDDDLRTKFIGPKEDLNTLYPGIVSVMEKNKEFYQKFSIPYLSYILANSASLKDYDSVKRLDKIKIQDYMSGELSREKGYQQQAAALYSFLYPIKQPQIQPYVSNAAHWADETLKYLTNSNYINMIAGRILFMHDFTFEDVNHFVKVLNLLDATSDKSSKLLSTYNKAGILAMLGKQNVDIADKDITASYAQWLNEFVEKFRASPDPQVVQTVNSILAIRAALGSYIEVAKNIVLSLHQPGYVSMETAASKLEELLTKSTGERLKGVVTPTICSFLVIGLGIFNLQKAFKGWAYLTDKERFACVVDAIGVAEGILKVVFDVTKAIKPGWFTTAMNNMAVSSEVKPLVDGEKAVTQIGREVNAAGEVEEASSLGRLFGKFLGTALKALGVIVSIGMLILSVCDIVEGFKTHNTTQIVFGFLNAAVAFLGVVVGVLEIMGVATSFCAGLGVVLVVVGIILAIVSMFIPQSQPPNPVDVFVDNQASNGGWTKQDTDHLSVDYTIRDDKYIISANKVYKVIMHNTLLQIVSTAGVVKAINTDPITVKYKTPCQMKFQLNGTVQILDDSEDQVTLWTTTVPDNKAFELPYTLRIENDGVLHVVDNKNHDLWRFQ